MRRGLVLTTACTARSHGWAVSRSWLLVLFSLPVLLFTPDGQRSAMTWRRAAIAGVGGWQTVHHLRHYQNVARYLLARMFFNDGMVGVLIFGGIYASGVFGWDSSELLIFGLCTSTSAMLGAYAGGKLDDLLGSKRTLMIAVSSTALIFLIMLSVAPGNFSLSLICPTVSMVAAVLQYAGGDLLLLPNQIFAIFFVTGLSSSRTLMARISPPSMTAQFFALYGLSGSVTAFLAPLMVATATDISAPRGWVWVP